MIMLRRKDILGSGANSTFVLGLMMTDCQLESRQLESLYNRTVSPGIEGEKVFAQRNRFDHWGPTDKSLWKQRKPRFSVYSKGNTLHPG